MINKKYYSLFWDKRQIKCLIYRIYLNIFGIFLGVKLVPLKISKLGIEFWYKGDVVIWIFHWKRRNNYIWTSILSECNYESLKQLDEFWVEYEEEYRKASSKRYEIKL